ncbi:TIGR04438 family Trp-rich protein [Thiomonas sp.]|jgi:small Trp-rich protein|uniref:TIGR04438 family Trp-rich protein n=1 Tax=Thiomonas sp. TaxID=2047785 RepID=UPI002607EA16|nr:TIGR04438 family Trp-rich protein [Thiomonas sp.]
MWILLVAILLLGLKLGAVGPFATLSWWWIAIPLGLAFLWWEIIDPMFGVSQRRAMNKVEERKAERNTRARRNLGLRAPPGGKNGKGR